MCASDSRSVVLSVENLHKFYVSNDPVLRGVNLCIRAGEKVALIGTNGAGKSTLMKCIVGLEVADRGVMTLLGERMAGRPERRQQQRIRRQLACIFQTHSLVTRQTVLTNVIQGYLGLPGGWRAWHHVIAPEQWRDAAMASLERVKLADKASSMASNLSGGQAQRVSIARALVRTPRLLIADEPAASLDPQSGEVVMEQLTATTAAMGSALLFTTHNLRHACRYADTVVGLADGQVVFRRSTDSASESELRELFDD